MKLKLWTSVLLLVLFSSCQKTVYQRDNGEIFHTSYHVVYDAEQSLQVGIDSVLQSINASLSMFNPNSTLSKINTSGTEPIDLSYDALALPMIEEALRISEWTHGAFDITVAPLVNLWGFGFSKSERATQAAIDSILAFVGYENLRLQDGCLLKKDARVMLDASGIAKGFACDRVALYLESQGVEDYLVEIGGEIRLRGCNENAQVWSVGIDKPIDDPTAVQRELQTVIQLNNKSMATSGNYRNFYMNEGRKVAHTIDPSTGYPVQHSILSATVICDHCLTADALATAFMVMGKDKAIELLESQNIAAPTDETVSGSAASSPVWAYLIYSDENNQLQTWCSPALLPYLK